ncbi:MAG: S8 family serine peptidase [Gemmatimonadota bacterium]
MYRSISVALLGAFALVLGACSAESPVSPDAEDAAATPEMSVQGLDQTAVPRYFVAYRGATPKGMETAVTAAGGSVDANYRDHGFVIVSGLEASAASDLRDLRGVTGVGEEPVIRLQPSRTSVQELTGSTIASPAAPATAAGFSLQWNLRAVGAPAAWDAGELGSSDVTLAILDTGIDATHPDLAGRVDPARSAVFHDRDDFIIPAFFPGSPEWADFNLHGTHVASIAASNALIFAGVTSGTTLLSVKVCDWEGLCPTLSVLEGIIHAIENGADVINMSLGGEFDKRRPKEGLDDPRGPAFVAIVNSVFNAAKRAGVTVVVAAGNDARDIDHNGSMFAAYCDAPHVICVSATAPASEADIANDGPWPEALIATPYTNFGRSAITVAAPGGDGDPTPPVDDRFVNGPCATTSLIILLASGVPCTPANFLGVAGTSQAAPHVSGLAASLVTHFGRNPARIRAAIQKGADDLGTNGTDPFFGKGHINVAASLDVD